ncbi:MAG: PASTA domain-containing protein [Calditrichaeota bacterium]|nr:MAG: PASTA domain-containing protein [Calditrichota bacterium]
MEEIQAHERRCKKRINSIILFGLIFALIILGKLFTIQVKDKGYYENLAERQHKSKKILYPIRGSIYDRNLKILATNKIKYSFSANPHSLRKKNKEKEILLNLLAETFNKPKSFYQNKLQSKKQFVWLEKDIEEDLAKKLIEAKNKNVFTHKNPKRYYPRNELAAQILGYTNSENNGQNGIEKNFNTLLNGREGFLVEQADGWGRSLPSLEYPQKQAVDGKNIVLTIDGEMQAIVQEELSKTVIDSEAKGGVVVLMNPKNSAILAMASYPFYDPNTTLNYDPSARKNKAITDIYEPGSTFKLVTAAGALNNGIISPDDSIFCENGKIKIYRTTIKDSKKYGWLSFKDVFAKSSNVGVIKVADSLGNSELFRYARAFGFGTETDIELIGEVKGILKNPLDWSGISRAEISIGHEVAVTALQTANAYCAIANGGKLMKPMIVKAVLNDQMEMLERKESVFVRRVVSEETAEKMIPFLEGVVQEGGTAEQAAVKGLRVGGKTGTAQRPGEEGGYSQRDYLASFVGIYPLENPQIVCLVMIDTPKKGNYWGGYISGPTFKRITERIIRLLRGANYQIDLALESGEKFSKKVLPEIDVPDLKGMNLDDAKHKLNQIGLEIKFSGVGKIVVEQIPEAGGDLEKQSFVEVKLAQEKPPENDLREVPSVVGLSVREAVNRLALEQIDFALVGNGFVKKQVPPPNSKVKIYSVCKLICD